MSKMWIAHPAMEDKPPVEIDEKQYYIWRRAGWRMTDPPPPPPTPLEQAALDLLEGKEEVGASSPASKAKASPSKPKAPAKAVAKPSEK